MNQKKGLVGKDMKPTSAAGAKPAMGEMGKPLLGAKSLGAKELPTKGAASRNLLSPEEVAERLRVSPGHVEQWLKDGILKGSLQGVQLYELEKFRAKHHRDILQAQHAPVQHPPDKATPTKSSKSQGKKPVKSAPPDAEELAPATAPIKPRKKSARSGPLQLVADAVTTIKNVVKATLGIKRKPEKVAPYVQPHQTESFPTAFQRPPVEPEQEYKDSPIQATDLMSASVIRAAVAGITGELTPPPDIEPSPGLEGETPNWLTTSVEPIAQSETLIMRSDQIMAAINKGGATAKPPPAPPAGPASSRELHEEKQRNQQLLLQLQEQRRAELEAQDELETLKQRLELSLTSEREIRSQLKRARQELQAALEELEQRPPADGADPEELKQLREKETQWAADKVLLEQQLSQLDQRRTLLEQQIERLRGQAEEIRQHGLQWHQLATQQDQQLRTLRQQHSDLEQEAGKSLGELGKKLRDSEAQRARAEILAEQTQQQLAALEAQVEQFGHQSGTADLQLDNKNKERTIQQLQLAMEQMQNQTTLLETQQRGQVQRWEQELQASASWVQKLTDAVTTRDRRIQELEAQVAHSSSRSSTFSEEELKSQVMSLRVELTSLRRNYEIVSLQAKTLDNQLQEARRAQQPQPPATLRVATPAALSLEVQGAAPADSAEDEGGFRRRLKQRLGTLSPSEEESRRRGLQPPPFLELDIPDS